MARRRRATGEIDRLPDEMRDTVEQMLLAGQSYREIVEYLEAGGVKLSQMSVCRYARRYLATVEQLRITQENMRMLMEEMEKYPHLDTTEAILRLASQNVFNAVAAVSPEAWEGIDPQKLLGEATALIRAAGYKRKIDAALKTDRQAALEENQALLFDVLARKHPDLYEKVVAVVEAEKSREETT